jgi:hypothetical protein
VISIASSADNDNSYVADTKFPTCFKYVFTGIFEDLAFVIVVAINLDVVSIS